MALFEIKRNNSNRQSDSAILKKSKQLAKAPATIKGGGSMLDRIKAISDNVQKNLIKYADDYEVITDKQRLQQYLKRCVLNKVISIDTETTGLDPMQDKIVGLCLYTPEEKAVYVPINHISYITNQRIENQLTEQEVADELRVILDWKIEVIMFNANFDIRVIRNQLGLKGIYCTWDCYLAARLMNENEPHKGLKPLHKKYVLKGQGDAFSFDELFKGISFNLIPINTGYLYAAHDAIITYEFYEFQKKYIYYQPECAMDDRNGMNGASWVFFNIEMPCVDVVCDMEDNGIELDLKFQQELSGTYNKMLSDKLNEFYKLLAEHQLEIDKYCLTNKNHKLSNPINIASPTQLQVLLYDILKYESPDTKHNPRGTDEATLSKMNTPITKVILEWRSLSKLLGTYIDKLPNCINPKDGRIHCNFNQYGADTGRFSSSDPNLQNIPSHNKDIRKMFKASDGYVLMSSDYSQQEPKVMTQMCGDPKMIKAYQEGKDLYAEIAALSFNTSYDNCLEFRPDGTTNPEGKNRRSQAKSILLGVLYGRGVPSIAEQLGTTTEKAQKIKDSVFKGFPAIPKFEQDSLDMAYECGYVTTLWGRKRRLPDLQLDEFEFSWINGKPADDLLDFDAINIPEYDDTEVPEDRINYYLRRLKKCRFGEKRIVFEEAKKEGIKITDNGGKIADAQRQCVNSRIQGSAADMSKLAMILVGHDKQLKELGFRLLIPVHDELIAECPIENAKICKERFAMLMSKAAESRLTIPIKCDVEVTDRWYGTPIDL